MISAHAIELRHLRYFLAVYAELHFGRAAEQLHISQPPLSQAIRSLEEALGVVLFRRTSRTVNVTEAGEAFAAGARQVLAGLEEAVLSARRAGGASSSLRVGSSPYIPIAPVHHFLADLRVRDPQLQTEVIHLVAVEQLRLLRLGELDLGIFPAAYSDPELEAEPLLAGEPLGLLVPVGHPLAAREIVGPADVSEETLITVPRSPNPEFQDGLTAHIEAGGYKFAGLVETHTMTAREVILGVADGLGVSLIPALAELSEMDGILVRRPLDPPLAMPDTVVAWRADRPAGPETPFAAARVTAREHYEQSRRSQNGMPVAAG